MARAIKHKEHAERRNEILDAAQRLIYTKGYEQMSIQDILDDLQMSKGAFYHYFGSKQALLEAMIERTTGEIERVLIPIVEDPDLPALAKLQRYFDAAARWKTARKAYMIELMRVWYDDHNALFRQKVFSATLQRVTPLLTSVVRQGIREGALTTAYPDQAGEIVVSIFQSLGDAFLVPLLLAREPDPGAVQRMGGTIAAYTDALERVLGAPAGSLQLIDAETLREWVS